VYWQGFYDAFRGACKETVDAAPLLAQVRMLKTGQEIERMRLANELAALGMEHARDNIKPGMRESGSCGHDRRAYSCGRRWLQRESGDGSRFHFGVVWARHCDVHRD